MSVLLGLLGTVLVGGMAKGLRELKKKNKSRSGNNLGRNRTRVAGPDEKKQGALALSKLSREIKETRQELINPSPPKPGESQDDFKKRRDLMAKMKKLRTTKSKLSDLLRSRGAL